MMGPMPPAGPEASRYRTDPDRRAPTAQREPAAQRERAIQELAARQHRMVSLPQLKVLALTASAVRDRVAAGKLWRVHHGVYAVGLAPLSIESIYMAAVLACGPTAALAHRSAAAHLGLRPCNRRNVDVIVLGRTGKGRKGIDVHRATGLEPRDITTVDDIPCTTVARTLLDLATTIDQTALERAVEQAEKLRIFDLAAVADVTTRACDRRAATNLQKALAAYTPEPAFTRSELEKRFLALCRAAGIRCHERTTSRRPTRSTSPGPTGRSTTRPRMSRRRCGRCSPPETEREGSARSANRGAKPIPAAACGADVARISASSWSLGADLERTVAGAAQALDGRRDRSAGRRAETAPFVERQHSQSAHLFLVQYGHLARFGDGDSFQREAAFDLAEASLREGLCRDQPRADTTGIRKRCRYAPGVRPVSRLKRRRKEAGSS